MFWVVICSAVWACDKAFRRSPVVLLSPVLGMERQRGSIDTIKRHYTIQYVRCLTPPVLIPVSIASPLSEGLCNETTLSLPAFTRNMLIICSYYAHNTLIICILRFILCYCFMLCHKLCYIASSPTH